MIIFVNSSSYDIGDLIVIVLNPCKIEKLRMQCWNFSKKNFLASLAYRPPRQYGPFRRVRYAGMGGPVAQHLATGQENHEVEITDMTDTIGKLDLPGPMSGKILKKVLLKPDDVCKVCSADQSVVLDADENAIGSVLTCVSDMGIRWYNDKIYSISSPDKPERAGSVAPFSSFSKRDSTKLASW